jgi:cytoskeletal protein RodZ
MAALGERFRDAREARGLTLSDVAEQIRIRSVYLAAIEDENWSVIGAPVYVRGFLRSYARFLGLDPEETVVAFNGAPAATVAPTPTIPGTSYRADTDPPARHLSPLIWVASIVAVALIAFIVYNEATFHQPAATVGVASQNPTDSPTDSPTPGPSEQASPADAVVPSGTVADSLELHLNASSWVRVVVDGSVSMEGTFPAGTIRSFHGKSARLRIGNAGGVEVVVDGKSLGTLGATGDVIERSFAL